MKSFDTDLSGVKIIELDKFEDSRGFFYESYNKKKYSAVGIDYDFVQDNHSFSKKGVLRGLHYQVNNPQGKLVSCLKGSVFDVALDIDTNSKTYGKYVGIELTDKNNLQLWIPPGYAHGFCVLSEFADFYYKCTSFYNPQDEAGVIWNDKFANIDWPEKKPILSEKDLALPGLNFKENVR